MRGAGQYLYVLEGSTLGAQIIFRQARASLNVSATCGASFFYGYGPSTYAIWKTLIAAINEIPYKGDAADAMECGARKAFEAFILAFTDQTLSGLPDEVETGTVQ